MSGRAVAAAVLAAGILLAGCATGEATPPPDAPTPQPADVQRPQLLAGPSAYVDAVARRDADALAAAFAPDGVVVDVQRRIAGREAIREWPSRSMISDSARNPTHHHVGKRADLLIKPQRRP
jgi:hypothetical protein